MAVLYWARLPEHTNMRSEGYVGVTDNLHKRTIQHKHRFKKYAGRIIVDALIIADKSYCYLMESILRPAKNIGWNFAIGGYRNNAMNGKDNPNFGKFGNEAPCYKGKYITPEGEFFDANVAAKHFGVNQSTIIRRCKGRKINGKIYNPVKGWAFVPEGRVKS